MSSRSLVLATLLLAAATEVAAAQRDTGLTARLGALAHARQDSLNSIRRQLDSLEKLRVMRTADTVRVGPIVIAASASRVTTARLAAETALAAAVPVLGSRRIAQSLAGEVFSVTEDTFSTALFSRNRTAFGNSHRGRDARNPGGSGDVPHVASELARFIAEAMLNRSAAQSVASLQGWTTLPVPSSGASGLSLAHAYEELVTWSTVPARGCAAGDLVACRAALGWHPEPDPLLAWFNEADRRVIGDRIFREQQKSGRADPDARSPCHRERDDAGCLAFLRGRRSAEIPTPLGPASRESMLLVALALGGDGALDRLAGDTSATVEGRLVAASGRRSDLLISAWRDRVFSFRPGQVGPEVRTVAGSMIWVFGFLALAALRGRAT